jgi:hypothetical protein
VPGKIGIPIIRENCNRIFLAETVLVPNISVSLKNILPAESHLAERHFFDEQTLNNEKVRQKYNAKRW